MCISWGHVSKSMYARSWNKSMTCLKAAIYHFWRVFVSGEHSIVEQVFGTVEVHCISNKQLTIHGEDMKVTIVVTDFT